MTCGAEHDFQDVFKKNGKSAGNGAYSRKRTTSRVMVASRPKVSFRPDDSTSPENYGWLFVITGACNWNVSFISSMHIITFRPQRSKINLLFSSHLGLGLPCDFFFQGFLITILYAFFSLNVTKQVGSRINAPDLYSEYNLFKS
jgi:hypothetical protein